MSPSRCDEKIWHLVADVVPETIVVKCPYLTLWTLLNTDLRFIAGSDKHPLREALHIVMDSKDAETSDNLVTSIYARRRLQHHTQQRAIHSTPLLAHTQTYTMK